MSDWTHPCCAVCWTKKFPDRDPTVIRVAYREREQCCFCGRETDAGIYFREDPREAPFHRRHD